ncbi:MAG: esterase/lipase family protein [Parvularculaceae bacterium]
MTIYVLVHGTFATPDGWFSEDGPLTRDLEAEGGRVERFIWSGRNSDRDRSFAARRLAKFIDGLGKDEPISIIAHSHGGNIAYDALAETPTKTCARVTVTTVGTPFLRKKVLLFRSLAFETFAVISVLISGLFVIELYRDPLAALAGPGGFLEAVRDIFINDVFRKEEGLASDAPFFERLLYWRRELFFVGAGLIAAIAFAQAWRAGLRERRIRAACGVNVIYHPDDEALQLLTKLDDAKLAPMNAPKSANRLTRSSYLMAFLLLPFIYAYGLSLLPSDVGTIVNEAFSDETTLYGRIVVYAALFVFWFGVSLVAAAILCLIFAGPYAYVVNRIVSSAVNSAALGVDHKFRILDVPREPRGPHDLVGLGPTVEAEMVAETTAAFARSAGDFKRFLTEIDSVSSDVFAGVIGEFADEELIHTSYFDFNGARAVIVGAATR